MNGSNQPHQHMYKKRWKLLIYPKFQLTLILLNGITLLLALGFVIIQIPRSFGTLKQLGVQVGLPAEHAYFKFLDFQTHTFYSNIAIAFVASFLFSTLCTLYLSHKLAGPIVRLKSYFSKIPTEGHAPEELKFRKRDFFTDLPPTINEALKWLQRKHE